MQVNSMQEKVDLLEQLLASGHFSYRELAKIAIGMELNASVIVLTETIALDANQRYGVLQEFQRQQAELNETT